jgi:hypothetical protein
MDNGLIFPYRLARDQAKPSVLRKALRGLPTPLVVGEQRGDAEG